nr:MAG TPA: hypothetical protein [Caudoviricetes sp.]
MRGYYRVLIDIIIDYYRVNFQFSLQFTHLKILFFYYYIIL